MTTLSTAAVPAPAHTLPAGYLEKVYAGVLGKLIGVYLGRPFEGWTHSASPQSSARSTYYVHERAGRCR